MFFLSFFEGLAVHVVCVSRRMGGPAQCASPATPLLLLPNSRRPSPYLLTPSPSCCVFVSFFHHPHSFESLLDIGTWALRLPEADVPQLLERLKARGAEGILGIQGPDVGALGGKRSS